MGWDGSVCCGGAFNTALYLCTGWQARLCVPAVRSCEMNRGNKRGMGAAASTEDAEARPEHPEQQYTTLAAVAYSKYGVAPSPCRLTSCELQLQQTHPVHTHWAGLTGVELRNGLAKWVGMELPGTLEHDYPAVCAGWVVLW